MKDVPLNLPPGGVRTAWTSPHPHDMLATTLGKIKGTGCKREEVEAMLLALLLLAGIALWATGHLLVR